MNVRPRVLLLLPALIIALVAGAPAVAGDILEGVKSRRHVRCGVSEGIVGFSTQDAAGSWSGLDIDFCRATAAAVLGDADAVRFVALRSSTRFPALSSNKIDVLIRNTTWTLVREALLKARFVGVLFFDGQALMVPEQSGLRSMDSLNGRTVCFEKGTTHERHLQRHLAARGLAMTPLVIDSSSEVAAAFFAGRCAAYSSDASQLAAARLGGPGGPQRWTILDERISKEPLGPVVPARDGDWVTLVRWVLNALVAAEEAGITRDNVSAAASFGPAPETDAQLSRTLGVAPGWAARAVTAAGNYGEMYERNLGRDSALKIKRGFNELWTRGGLHYAPPFE